MTRYLDILGRRGAWVPFVLSFLARFPISMVPIGMVLFVQQLRGAYGVAGLTAAAYALATAVFSPLWGVLVDRVGQPRVIAPLSVLTSALLAGFAAAAVGLGPLPAAGDGVLIALAAGIGAAYPPVGPAMRAAWRELLDDARDLHAAYALEAVAIELVFVLGPLLLSGLIAVAAPQVPLLVTAALMVVGGVGYSLTAAARACRAHPVSGGDGALRGPSPLTARAVLLVLAVGVLLSCGFGQLDVSVAAMAVLTLGSQAKVGLLFTMIAGGSAVGGLLYGSRRWPGAGHQRVPVLLATFCVGVSAVAALLRLPAVPLVALMPLLFLAGLAVAPAIIELTHLVDQHSAPDRLNEAQSWFTTAMTAGGAVGSAVAGHLVDSGGPSLSTIGAAAAMGVAAVISLAGGRLWRRPAGGPAGGGPAGEGPAQPAGESTSSVRELAG